MKDSPLARLLVFVALSAAAAAALGWLLSRFLKEEEDLEMASWVPTKRPSLATPPQPDQPEFEVALDEPDAAVHADDLTQIDGIGPRYAAGLLAMGILTFRQLSEQSIDALAEGMRAQGLRIIGDRIAHDDWIGQARRLMAEG